MGLKKTGNEKMPGNADFIEENRSEDVSTDVMTDADEAETPATMGANEMSELAFSLGQYQDGDYITKVGLSAVFSCTERTLQRMVERFEIPPPMLLAGRKVWIVGKLRSWIASAADRHEAEALKAAKKMRVFEN